MRKDSEFEPEKKSSPTNITPVERMKSIPRYSPTEDTTAYAPPPRAGWFARLIAFVKRLVRSR